MAPAVLLVRIFLQHVSAQLLVLSIWLQNITGLHSDKHRKLGPSQLPADNMLDFGGSTSGFTGVFNNSPFLAAFTAFAAAQIAKVFTHYYIEVIPAHCPLCFVGLQT
jgi:hypothetical protein